MSANKNFYLDHLGCAKNQVDSEVMAAVLTERGWRESSLEAASVVIINTCGFTEAAKKESIDHFFSFSKHYPDKRLVLAGCMAQRYGQQLKSLMPEAQGIFGSGAPERLAEFLAKLDASQTKETQVWLPQAEFGKPVKRSKRLSTAGSAFLKIGEGCSNGCRFCAIPLIKGPARSRSIDDIAEEFRYLRQQDVFEINLVAQDLSSFNRNKGGLLGLLQRLAKEPGDFWVRLLYIHPDHFPLQILDFMAADSRFLPYFDLPFQHAGQNVLRRMGRAGDASSYLALLQTIRAKLPAAVVRSTFLLGFPGETEQDFAELLAFQEQACLDWAGAFVYSREEGTAAYNEAGKRLLRVAKPLARERERQVMERQSLLSQRALQRFAGQKQTVLIEERIEGENLYLGRFYACAPEVDGLAVLESSKSLDAGDRVSALITGLAGFDFKAVLA